LPFIVDIEEKKAVETPLINYEMRRRERFQ